MAHHHVSDMTLEELDHFVDANRDCMQLSAADGIALHLRRQRRAYLSGREQPPLDGKKNNGSTDGRPRKCLRILLLGEETNAKLELAALLCGGKRDGAGVSRGKTRGGDATPPLLDLGFAEDAAAAPCSDDYDVNNADGDAYEGSNDSFSLSQVELLVPGVADVTASLRAELCIACDVIVACFSITDRGTFNAIRQRWWKEAARAFAVLAQDISDARGKYAIWPLTPVVVVGIGAEARHAAVGRHVVAVSHEEAVQLAQEMGASKYIEIIPGNLHHAHSVATQCLQVVRALNQSLSPAAASFLFSSRRHMLQCHLRVPRPEVVMDLVSMQLRVRKIPGIVYVMSADGTSERHRTGLSSLVDVPGSGVVDLRVYRRQPGTVLHIYGKARCAYTSAPLKVEVPSTVEPPCGFFDMARRQFVVVPNDIPFTLRDVRYTIDGTQPTRDSLQYMQPIELDAASTAERPWGPWRGSAPPPREIRLTAFAEDEFPSPTVAYQVPSVLETPKIVYSPHDSTVSLESMQTMVHYRYTLDGTTPTYESPLYTGPLSLAVAATRQMRVMAFPKLFFPSREAVFYVPNAASTVNTATKASAKRNEEASGRTFHTTRASMMRGKLAVRRLHFGESDSCVGGASVSSNRSCGSTKSKSEMERERLTVSERSLAFSSSRSLSPRLQTEVRAAMPRCRSGNKDVAKGTAADAREWQRRASTPRCAQSRRRTTHSEPQSSQRSSRVSATNVNDICIGDDDDDDDGADSLLLTTPVAGNNRGNARISGSKSRNGGGGGGAVVVGANAGKENVFKELDMNANKTNAAPICTADGNTVVFAFPKPIRMSHIDVTTPGGGAGPTSYEVEVKHAHGANFLTVGGGELRDVSGIQTMHVLESTHLFLIDQVRCVFSGGAAGFRVMNLKVHGKPF